MTIKDLLRKFNGISSIEDCGFDAGVLFSFRELMMECVEIIEKQGVRDPGVYGIIRAQNKKAQLFLRALAKKVNNGNQIFEEGVFIRYWMHLMPELRQMLKKAMEGEK